MILGQLTIGARQAKNAPLCKRMAANVWLMKDISLQQHDRRTAIEGLGGGRDLNTKPTSQIFL